MLNFLKCLINVLMFLIIIFVYILIILLNFSTDIFFKEIKRFATYFRVLPFDDISRHE